MERDHRRQTSGNAVTDKGAIAQQGDGAQRAHGRHAKRRQNQPRCRKSHEVCIVHKNASKSRNPTVGGQSFRSIWPG
jgi:hypothetical protein